MPECINKSILLLSGFITALSFAQTTLAFATCEADMNSGIQKIIDDDRIKYQMPGVEVSIHCKKNGYAHDFVSGTITMDGNQPVKPEHLFQIGSETKSFIAAIILQLEAEGKLTIDDPVGNYLSDLPDLWNNITIRQLLNHTSGIYNYTDVLHDLLQADSNIDLKKQWMSRELINLVDSKPLYFETGRGWHYSNTNYVLAGMIIEIVTGNSLNYELGSRLIKPLHLDNTYYLSSLYNDQMMQRMAHGYSDRGYFPDFPDESKDITDTNISWANAAGAMISTSHDMAIWFKKLLDGSLFPAEQQHELLTFVDAIAPTGNSIGYGLGVMHDIDTFGEEALWHSGGTMGYSAMMVWLANHDIIITANVNHITAKRDIYFLVHDLAFFIIGKSHPLQSFEGVSAINK